MEWTMAHRRALTKKLAQGYRGADRKGKGEVLDTLVKLNGYNRCYAGWLLRHWGRKYLVKMDGRMVQLVVGAVRARVAAARPRHYGEPVLKVLKRIWESFDYMCGQRLAAMIKETLPVLVGAGELYCSGNTFEKLLTISGATIDRLLRPYKAAMRPRGRSHTKPSSLLKAQIPIRSWSELPVNEPGHYQADLVGHDGGNAGGEYAFSLDCIELFSGWSEPRCLQNRGHVGVCTAVQDIHRVAPVPMQSLHTDTGGEFINLRLLDWCQRHHIELQRGRPYRRNGLLVNHFYPSMKLVEKRRVGSHVYKRYDVPKSPYRRLLDCADLAEDIKERLREEHRRLRPLQLKKRIADLQEQLYRLARAKCSPANGLVPAAETIDYEEVPILTDSQV
jgi:hypothetical protein